MAMHDERVKSFEERLGSVARPANVDDVAMLPVADGTYKAFGRVGPQPMYTLHCLKGAGACRSFQYVHLESDSSFSADKSGQVISLRFSGLKTIAVTIRGRSLRTLYDLIHQHKVPWIAEIDAGRDFGADNEPIITSIDLAEVRHNGEDFAAQSSAKVLEME